MAQLPGGTFDPNQHEPQQPLEPLPTGWYVMRAVESEVKPTKDQTGQYLQVVLEIDETYHPQLKGRKVWERLNLVNQNAQAVEIANRTLSAICLAAGVQIVNDSEELHHKPMAVRVVKKPAQGQYMESNEVKGYDTIAKRFPRGAAPATAAPAQQAAPQQPAAAPAQEGGGETPPWAG